MAQTIDSLGTPGRMSLRAAMLAALLLLMTRLAMSAVIPGDTQAGTLPLQPGAVFPSSELARDQRLGQIMELLEAGRRAEALALARNAVAAEASDPHAHELLGTALALNGNLDGALAALVHAIDLDPGQVSAHVKAGLVLLHLRRTDDAVGRFRAVLELDPENVVAHQRLGFVFASRADYAAATKHLVHAHRGMPEDMSVRVALARVYQLTGHNADARDLLSNRVAAQDTSIDAFMILGAAQLALMQHAGAVDTFSTARQRWPDEERPVFALAAALRSEGAPYEAAVVLETWLERNPESVQALVTLGETFLIADRPDLALDVLVRAANLVPMDVALIQRLGQLQLRAGGAEQAVSALLRLREGGAEDNRTLSLLAGGYEALARLDEAEVVYRTMIAKQPRALEGYRALMSFEVRQARYHDAIATARAGLAQLPDTPVLLQALSVAQRKAGRPAAALDTARRLLSRDPGDPERRFFLAVLMEETGNRAGAVHAYRQTLAADPGHTRAANNLAGLLSRQGEHTEALLVAERVFAAMAPGDAVVTDTYAMVLRRSGQVRQAREILEQAADAGVAHAPLYYHLARLQLESGDESAARTNLERALSLSESFPEAQEAKALLAQ